MKTLENKRIIGFLLIALIMVTGGITYAAVPNDTLRTTVAGVSTLVVDYFNSTNYYLGTTNVTGYILNADPAGGATFATINTGYGNYEHYAMDQNVLTSSNVNFTNVEADDYWLNDNTNLTAWVETLVTSVNNTAINVTRSYAEEYYRNGNNYTAWIETEIANVNGSAMPAIYDFLVLNETSTVAVYNRTDLLFTETDFSSAAKWALGNATGLQRRENRRVEVYFRGHFVATSSVDRIGNETIVDGYGCTIEVGANNVGALFRNYDMGSNRSILGEIRGFYLIGNKGTYSNCSGIQGTFWDFRIYNNIITGFDGYGIDLRSYTNKFRAKCKIDHNQIGTGLSGGGNSAGGVRLGRNGYGTSDCQIHHNKFLNNGNWQIIIENGATHRIVENHFAGYADAGDNPCGGIYAGRYEYTGSADVDKVQVIGNHGEQIQLQFLLVNATAGAFCDGWNVALNDLYNCSNRLANNTYSTIHFWANGGQTRYGVIDGNHFKCELGNYRPAYAISLEGANAKYFCVDSNVREPAASWDDIKNDAGGDNVIGDNVNIS